MADNAVVHIGENSPEQVAYKLLQDVMIAEARTIAPQGVNGKQAVDRKWLLDAYAECLHATTGCRSTSSGLRGYKTDAT